MTNGPNGVRGRILHNPSFHSSRIMVKFSYINLFFPFICNPHLWVSIFQYRSSPLGHSSFRWDTYARKGFFACKNGGGWLLWEVRGSKFLTTEEKFLIQKDEEKDGWNVWHGILIYITGRLWAGNAWKEWANEILKAVDKAEIMFWLKSYEKLKVKFGEAEADEPTRNRWVRVIANKTTKTTMLMWWKNTSTRTGVARRYVV
jgi:hypothetical protein